MSPHALFSVFMPHMKNTISLATAVTTTFRFMFFCSFDQPQIFLRMIFQPLDPVIKFHDSKIAVFGIPCFELASINGYKTRFQIHHDSAYKLTEDFFQTVDIVLSEIRYRSKIQHQTSQPAVSFREDRIFLRYPI